MMESPQHFAVRTDIESREVEEGQGIAIANVEEKVIGAR